ncbi:SRPBCC family protein [Thalassobellus citreus]|uniref:SRPBCC family protein n=1 Tax=Thalassobellus citreus TaxID=3367752 RepID=UPI0037A59F85
MIIKKETIIHSNIEKCWNVLGKNFANAHEWASAIKHSEGSGDSFSGASCSNRKCEVKKMGHLNEKLLNYSNDTHSLKYEIIEGLPKMIKKATNSWSLSALDTNKSKLTMEMDMNISGFLGTLMKPIMKIQMGNMGNVFLEEFKYYVEKGKPHPRKN